MQALNPCLLTMILSPEQEKKLAAHARKLHVSYTTLLGQGTVASHMLQMLGISSHRREMVMILMHRDGAEELVDNLAAKLKLEKPGNGIAYMTEVVACAGSHSMPRILPVEPETEEDEKTMQKITVIVERGNADRVMDIAREQGARGGTILHGRGSTGKEAQSLFGIQIEEEKEVVLILAPVEITPKIFRAIEEGMELDEPGKGILFVEPLTLTRGLVDTTQKETKQE